MAAEAGPLVVKADENRKKFTGKRLIKRIFLFAEFNEKYILRLFCQLSFPIIVIS